MATSDAPVRDRKRRRDAHDLQAVAAIARTLVELVEALDEQLALLSAIA